MPAQDGETTVRVFNVNTALAHRRHGADARPARHLRRRDAASTAWPARRRRSGSNFLDAWGAVTGSLFPTGRRIDMIDGVQVTCIDAAMPLDDRARRATSA